MSPNRQTTTQWSLASVDLADAWTDFVLSRQAMGCSVATLEWYKNTAGKFLEWLENQGVTAPSEVTARYVRAYLAELAARKLQAWTRHGHARAIRTLVRFWCTEGYIPSPIKFDMPKLEKKRLPVLTADQLSRVLAACKTKRDKALIMFLVDTGLRRMEAVRLNWEDLDMQSGLVLVKHGKGGKDRSVVVGAKTRRAVLAYRRTLENREGYHPIFQTYEGQRFTGAGIRQVIRRISERAGIHFTPHALRRTFTILSLRAGMDVLHLQALLGHESLDMVRRYAQLADIDLLEEHHKHSPIDSL